MRYAILIAAVLVLLPSCFASARTGEESSLARCVLQRDGARYTGTCGSLLAVFDKVPTVTLASVRAIASGAWNNDVGPTSTWAGQASTKNDPNEPVELEVYPDGWGILRTEFNWSPVTDFTASPGTLQFDLYAYDQIAPNALDRRIVQRAATLLTTERAWNRKDNRQCPAAATSWSIYCALEKATIETTGGFHHRRPALQVVRIIVDERSVGRDYNHRLMDYNNDPRTHLSDVQSLLREALVRMTNEQWLTTNGFVRPVDGGFEPG